MRRLGQFPGLLPVQAGDRDDQRDHQLEHVAVAERVERLTDLVEELTSQRALERVGERVVLLVEEHDDEDPTVAVGRAEHQGPDVDGVCLVRAGADGVLPGVMRGLLLDVARAGAGVLLITEELEEAIALAGRILVIYEGRIVGEVSVEGVAADDAHELINHIGLLMGGGS